MSLYSAEDERRIRSQTLVREWTRSGLLDPSQGAALEAELRVDVRRTNVYLRVGLALFAALIVAASVAFVIVVLDVDSSSAIAAVTAVAACVCLGLAHYLAGDAIGARDIWKTCLQRRPENVRVEAYLSMLGRTEA